jgi:peptidyl-prolyl cis-trans isomerase D
MLEFFRRTMKSRVGALIGIGFLALIALAFASADISNTGSFGGVAGGDRVATVGGEAISTSELSRSATNALENLKQENPQLTMQQFLAAKGLEDVLDSLIARVAVHQFGERHGIIAGDRLIDSEIAQIPAFKGPDGKFSETAYKQLIQQRGLSDAQVREDLGQGLVARQILVPAGFGTVVPTELARRYAALLRENRKGAIALIPSLAFAPAAPPGDAELQAWYTKNRARFTLPERRTIRYATFGESALKSLSAPTEAEIAARYAADKPRYQAVELRRVTQLILPTEAAAKAVAADVAKGASLSAAATARGLAVSTIGPASKGDMAAQSSAAIAEAAFAAPAGGLTGPARGTLGWALLRVDAVETRAGRSLDQARGEIVAALTEQKRRAALIDLSSRLEEELDGGGNLTEAAAEIGATLQTTAPLTANGAVFGKPSETAPPVLARVVQTAFSMERENQPQLAEVEPGKTFVIFDVGQITPSAPAPLAEIRNDVLAAWVLEKGSAAAKAAAQQVQAAVRKGTKLEAAIAGLKRPLPPVRPVDMNREQLTANREEVPPSLMLLFSMAQGTVKTLAGPGNQGWFVVALDRIEAPEIKVDDPLVAAAQRELGSLVGREYAEQLGRAIRADVGAERNETAIRAVSRQLVGGN